MTHHNVSYVHLVYAMCVYAYLVLHYKAARYDLVCTRVYMPMHISRRDYTLRIMLI